MSFEKNVFINCPFDKEYKPILKAVYFSILYLDYFPLLSETTDSSTSRVTIIQSLIEKAKYSIHDLSRMESSRKNELARFNMPFELGMDIGCKRYTGSPFNSKRLLILDKEKYRYQKAISDLSGNDIAVHDFKAEQAVRQIRNWIYKIQNSEIDSANKIWNIYNEFSGDFFEISEENELSQDDIDQMPWEEYGQYISNWLEKKRRS